MVSEKKATSRDNVKIALTGLFERSMNGLLHLIDKGIKTLDRNMDGEDVPPSTQVRAARLVELEETVKEIKG